MRARSRRRRPRRSDSERAASVISIAMCMPPAAAMGSAKETRDLEPGKRTAACHLLPTSFLLFRLGSRCRRRLGSVRHLWKGNGRVPEEDILEPPDVLAHRSQAVRVKHEGKAQDRRFAFRKPAEVRGGVERLGDVRGLVVVADNLKPEAREGTALGVLRKKLPQRHIEVLKGYELKGQLSCSFRKLQRDGQPGRFFSLASLRR
jgi:hypothetical protein